jgi:hypothetical protein
MLHRRPSRYAHARPPNAPQRLSRSRGVVLADIKTHKRVLKTVGALMRAHDWSTSTLGGVARAPEGGGLNGVAMAAQDRDLFAGRGNKYNICKKYVYMVLG